MNGVNREMPNSMSPVKKSRTRLPADFIAPASIELTDEEDGAGLSGRNIERQRSG